MFVPRMLLVVADGGSTSVGSTKATRSIAGRCEQRAWLILSESATSAGHEALSGRASTQATVDARFLAHPIRHTCDASQRGQAWAHASHRPACMPLHLTRLRDAPSCGLSPHLDDVVQDHLKVELRWRRRDGSFLMHHVRTIGVIEKAGLYE